jgi:hypothetical protein
VGGSQAFTVAVEVMVRFGDVIDPTGGNTKISTLPPLVWEL